MYKKYKAKVVKIDLGENIEKYTILVYDTSIEKWITCGKIDPQGNELISVFDEDYEAEAFIEIRDNLELIQ
ncbi:hypothetical protein DZC34_09330 [Clostridium botulinum]|nr:hypothetical protein DZC34_09330 [Clostridium botulinum]